MLADIEIAQTLQSETEKALAEEKVEDVPHPVDQNYNSLKCSLELLDGATEEFKVRGGGYSLHGVPQLTCVSRLFCIHPEGH